MAGQSFDEAGRNWRVHGYNFGVAREKGGIFGGESKSYLRGYHALLSPRIYNKGRLG